MPIDLDGKRLLLIKPSSLGDIVHAVPTAWALKERWPNLHLTWLVNRGFEALIKPITAIDETLPFDRSRFKGLFGPIAKRGEFRSFTRSLKDGRFDAVLDLQGLFRSGLFARLTGAAIRVGDREAREGAWWFYNRRVETPSQPVHARERYAALAAELGADKPTREDLCVQPAETEAAQKLLAEAGFSGGPLVTVCPGARWETKVYPARHFAELLDTLAERAGVTRPVLVGGDDLADSCDKIVAACKVAAPVNLAGKTSLRELAALLSGARLMITCDSGPMHIAAAQGTPTLAIFGPTDARRTGPYGQLENVVKGQCDLMPCLKRRCPGRGLQCMRDLSAMTVAEKALALLAGKSIT